MKLQTQIRLGMCFLLALLMVTGGAAIFFLRESERDAAAMETIVIVCLLLAGTFALNFPAVLTRPLRQITDDIREIAGGQYDRRVFSETHDEFGEIAGAVNHLTANLEASARPHPVKAPLAALKRHAEQLEEQSFARLSPEQLMIIARIKSDCQRLLQSAGNQPGEKI
ncbi:MAG: HAMP domain-containing protein [Saprospirales bacterium]|nr:HAMP domain-containing protein [Saprospirales bacterium]